MDVQAGMDPCWSQTHFVGFVMARLNYFLWVKKTHPNIAIL
jgi:hypothetical protein